MAFSYDNYTGNGTTTQFSITFTYQNTSEISVTVDGVAETGLTFPSASTVQLTSAPAIGTLVQVRRTTDLTTRAVDFASGSVLTEEDLDNSSIQTFHASQEAIDRVGDAIALDTDNKWDAQGSIIKNVGTPVNNNDAVNKQFISTNLPNITTVAGIASDVTTVAGIASDVTAVVSDAADISTVSTNIASVNTVATNIADVITVANDLNEAISEIETAANDLNEAVSEIDTVANSIANVNTVGTNIASVNTVAGISSDVTAVAADATDIGTVASSISNVNTVAGISGNVATVAGISANVTAVAGDATDIGTVASNITNVNNVAANSANITSVAGNATNINNVASNATNINAVAADATDIGIVAGAIANVNAVGTDIANVNTVATNLTDINSFANTYFISATAPSSPTEGDLWFDTTNDVMKVYDGSGFVNAGSSVNGTSERQTYTATSGQTSFAATYDAGYVDVYLNGVKLIAGTDFTATDGANVVLTTGAALNDTVDIVAFGTFNLLNLDISNDTTPQLGGNLDTNGNDVTFGDNDKATFGAGSDLQIYHDGVHSYVKDAGSGSLFLQSASNIYIQNAGGTANYFKGTDGGASELFHNGSTKLATTSTGVDVTGTVTVTRSDVPNDNSTVSNEGGQFIISAATGGGGGTYPMLFKTNNAERMRIDSSGNLLVGTTTNGTTADGTVIRASAETLMTRSNGAPLLLNRRGTDGAVLEVRNDNSTVGYISANASGMGVYLGGTGSANHLDDYEEGTWTVNVYKNGSALAVQTRYGHYTKIGNLVYVAFYWYNSSGLTTTGSTEYTIQGIPFTLLTGSANGNQFIPAGYVYIQSNRANTDPMYRWQANSTNALHLYGVNATTNVSSGVLEFSGTGVLRVA